MPQDAGEHRPISPMPEQQQDAPEDTTRMDAPTDPKGSGQHTPMMRPRVPLASF